MIKFDFNKYIDKFLDKDSFNKYLRLKGDVLEKFSLCEMTGWTREIDKDLVSRCVELSKKVKANSDCLVVIGIGGSFLGSLCVNEMMGKYFNNDQFKVIYAGTTLSSKYMDELLVYLWRFERDGRYDVWKCFYDIDSTNVLAFVSFLC